MTENKLQVSAKMAAAMGIFLPLAETIRRNTQLLDYKNFFKWFDDYMLGFILLWAAYLVLKKRKNAVAYLIAAWGIGAGALFLSFLGQFTTTEMGGFPTTFVAAMKGLILVYMLIGLNKAIQSNLIESWNNEN